MIRISLFFFVSALIGRTFSAESQSQPTPAQLLSIMERSSLVYTIAEMEEQPRKSRTRVLTRKDVRTWMAKQGPMPLGTSPKGLSALESNDCDKAVKLLVKRSDAYRDLGLEHQLDLCKCLEKKEDWAAGKDILEELLDRYPQHFEIHRRLARTYIHEDRTDLATDHQLRAWIYNRNHSLIQEEALARLRSQGGGGQNWQWEPQVEISRSDDGPMIRLHSENTWLAYGICEALWRFEPGYAVQKESDPVRRRNLRDLECLGVALTTYAYRDQIQQTIPAMEALNKAWQHDLLDAFILFELRLPKEPTLAFDLTEVQNDQIVTYLKTCR